MLFAVGDDRPGLLVDGRPARWWDGPGALLLASSAGVRVNVRGVYTLRAPLRDLRALGWARAACNASAFALCTGEFGHVLPAAPPRLPERPGLLPAGWDALGCERSDGKVLVAAGTYDVSACDILDHGWDVVYAGGQASLLRTGLPWWAYWAVVLVALVQVRGLSYNLQAVWTRAPSAPDQRLTLLAALALPVGLVALEQDRVYATEADQLVYWATVAYLGCYLALHLIRFASDGGYEQPVFNAIVAALHLAAIRLYTGAQTPYTPVLLGMLACRVWGKLLALPAGLAWHQQATLLMDSLYLSATAEVALGHARPALVGIYAAAFVAARLLRV